MSSTSVMNRLAAFGSALGLETLPEEVVDKAKISIIDAIEGCVDGSAVTEICEPVLRAFKPLDPADARAATLFGTRGVVGADDAVFYNIVTGTFSARNDIHTGGRVHPGCTLVPAMLAQAETLHLSGRLVLEAVALGYEMMIRLGMALQKGSVYPLSGNLRASMLPTPFGVAFACAKLFGLDGDRMANAAALALNHICGVNQWRLEASGEDAYQNAWDALNAISSTRFAAAGVQGAKGNLDGEFGFLALFGARDAADALAEGLGSEYKMLTTKSKPVGACMRLLAPCQLAQDLLEDPAFKLSELGHIDVKVTKRVASNPWFSSTNINGQSAAINSVPYGIAGVLQAGDINAVPWYPPYNDDALALMDKVTLVYDDYCRDHLEPEGCRIIARMKDGSVIEKERIAFAPLDRAGIERKFTHTLSGRYGEQKTAEMLKLANALEAVEDVAEFTHLFR